MRAGAVLVAALLLNAGASHAEEAFPSRTIRIYGQGMGSTADYLSRYLAQKLQERWNQPVIVDSRSGTGVTVLVINPAIPATNAQEFIAYAKRKGDPSYASAGNGTISHLTGELLKSVTNVPT